MSELIKLIELSLEQDEVLARIALHINQTVLKLLKSIHNFQKVPVPLVLSEEKLIVTCLCPFQDGLRMDHQSVLVEKCCQSLISVTTNAAQI